MRKIFIVSALVMLILSSCSKDDKDCWKFIVTVRSVNEYSSNTVSTSTTTQCDLTEDEAESVRKSLESNSYATVGGVTIRVITTATKQKI